MRRTRIRARPALAIRAMAPVVRCTVAFCTSVSIGYASALPEGAHLVKGAVNIAQTGGDRPAMTIQQQERIALVEWQTFNIGEHASLQVVSGNPESLLINRVTGNAESRIDGALHADGAVWLINPNGYLVGSTAHIGTREFLTAADDIDSTSLLEMASTMHGYVPAAMRTSNFIHSRRQSEVNVVQAKRSVSAAAAPSASVQTDRFGAGTHMAHAVSAPMLSAVTQNSTADASLNEAQGVTTYGQDDAKRASPGASVRTNGVLPIPQPLDVPVLPTLAMLTARSFMSCEDPTPSPLALPPPPSLGTPDLASRRLEDEPSGTPTISISRPPSLSPPLPPLTRLLVPLHLNSDLATDKAITDVATAEESRPRVPRAPAIRLRRLGMPSDSDATLPTEPFALPPLAWARLEAGAELASHSFFPLGYQPTHRHDVSAYHDYAPITRVPSSPFKRGPTTFGMDADRYSNSSHSYGSAD